MSNNETSQTCRPRGRALGFVAGAAFMCVLSGAVGAGAATLITSAQIKDGTIVGADVKNGGLTGADVKDSSIASRDVKNGSLTGGDIKDASVGSADLSSAAKAEAMTGLIPSGTTVTGTVFFDSNSSTAGDFGVSVALPGAASAPLTNTDVNFANTAATEIADEDNVVTCSGSANAPSAPAGKVCLYLVTRSVDSYNIRGAEIYQKPSAREFAVRWSDTAADSSDVFITAVWAYTAP